MTIDSNTGVISWPITPEASGNYEVELAAQDRDGLKTTQKYTFSITLCRRGTEVSHLLDMKIRSSRGFTAIEMIIVLVIISVLSAMAVPSFLQWRQSLEARETARDFVNILRLAKSDAINTNLEQEVQFNAVSQQYGKQPGQPGIQFDHLLSDDGG